jgi:hypothetical protein
VCAKPYRPSKDPAGFATDMGIAALAYIAEDAQRLSRFLDISGLGPHNLRKAAAEPTFLGAVLEYLGSDEKLLVAFAESRDLTPEAILRARDALAGRPPDWP